MSYFVWSPLRQPFTFPTRRPVLTYQIRLCIIFLNVCISTSPNPTSDVDHVPEQIAFPRRNGLAGNTVVDRYDVFPHVCFALVGNRFNSSCLVVTFAPLPM